MEFSTKEAISDVNKSGFSRVVKIEPDPVGWGMHGSWGNGPADGYLLKNVAVRGVRRGRDRAGGSRIWILSLTPPLLVLFLLKMKLPCRVPGTEKENWMGFLFCQPSLPAWSLGFSECGKRKEKLRDERKKKNYRSRVGSSGDLKRDIWKRESTLQHVEQSRA